LQEVKFYIRVISKDIKFIYSPQQEAMHLTRHAVPEITSEKNTSTRPLRIAVATLVATIPTAKSTVENKIAPSMPTIAVLRELQTHLQSVFLANAAPKSKTAR
jgi:hypothetical protein